MATTITNFMEQAVQKQFARDILFRVKQITIAGVSLNGETDLIYAKTAALPGRDISNKNAAYFGQNFNVPGASTYPGSDSYSIEFYHDEGINIRKKLEAASRAVFNNDTSTGDYRMPGRESVIILTVLNRALEEIETIELIGASIRTVGEIAYTIAEGTGEILSFPVTFSYHFYNNIA